MFYKLTPGTYGYVVFNIYVWASLFYSTKCRIKMDCTVYGYKTICITILYIFQVFVLKLTPYVILKTLKNAMMEIRHTDTIHNLNFFFTKKIPNATLVSCCFLISEIFYMDCLYCTVSDILLKGKTFLKFLFQVGKTNLYVCL